jgi:purine-binding chemotaxis protein CheW
MHERQLESVDAARRGGQYLSFHLGLDDYAVDILRVQEIRGWENVRALPEAQGYVKGVLDLRGTIVPIIDLRIRFGSSEPDYAPTTVVIVLSVVDADGRSQLVGAVVDGVSDVLKVDAVDLKPPPEFGGAVSRRYLDGMVSLERGIVILLDIDRLFDVRELDQLAGGSDRE